MATPEGNNANRKILLKITNFEKCLFAQRLNRSLDMLDIKIAVKRKIL